MTITYTYQYRFLPKQWKCPTPPEISADEQEDILRTLEYRRIIAPFLTDSLNFLNTYRCIIRYIIYPIFILALAIGIIGWTTFLILSFIVAILSIVIWIKIKIYHRMVSIIQIVIDESIYIETGIRIPKIFEKG